MTTNTTIILNTTMTSATTTATASITTTATNTSNTTTSVAKLLGNCKTFKHTMEYIRATGRMEDTET